MPRSYANTNIYLDAWIKTSSERNFLFTLSFLQCFMQSAALLWRSYQNCSVVDNRSDGGAYIVLTLTSTLVCCSGDGALRSPKSEGLKRNTWLRTSLRRTSPKWVLYPGNQKHDMYPQPYTQGLRLVPHDTYFISITLEFINHYVAWNTIQVFSTLRALWLP